MKRHLIFALVFSCFCLVTEAKTIGAKTPSTQTKSTKTKSTITAPSKFTLEAPAGFAELAKEGDTLVDLFSNGRKVGEVAAAFNAKTITFTDPKEVVSLLSTVRDHKTVIEAMKKPLPIHKALICNKKSNDQQCGYIQADTVAVIFNIDELRADIFVNQLYTYNRDSRARYLPPPTVSPGFLATLNVSSYNDLENDINQLNANLRMIAGAGRWSVQSSLYGNESGGGHLNAASVNYQGKNIEIAIGSLPYRSGSQLARSASIVGFRISSSLKTWLNKQSLQRPSIPISVNSVARVEIYKNGRRIDTQTIKPTDRFIDSSRFPRGNYDITLKITENGVTREETRFYSLGNQLPLGDAPQWYFEVGKPTYNKADHFVPLFRDEPTVMNMGYIKRLTKSMGFSGHLSVSKDDQYSELSLFKVGANYTAKIGLLGSADGDYGGFVSASVRGKKWSLSARYSQLTTKDPVATVASDDFDPFSRSYKRGNMNAVYQLGRGRVGIQGYYSQYNDGRENYYIGPYVSYDVYRTRRSRLTLTARSNRGKYTNSNYVGLNYSTILDPKNRKRRVRVTHSAQVNSTYQKSTDTRTTRETLTSRMTMSKRNQYGYQDNYSAQVRHDANKKDTLKVGVRRRLPYAEVSAEASYGSGGQKTINTRLLTGLAIGSGHVALYSRPSQGGTFVNIKGNTDAEFDVVANHSKVAVTRTNKTVFVPQSAYKIYDVGISSKDLADVEYSDDTDRLVIYPGNIPVIDRKISKVSILVGQVVSADKKPVSLASIKADEELGVTDEKGYFQIEYRDQQALDLYKNGLKVCRISMTHVMKTIKKDDAYRDIGVIRCR